MNTHVFYKLTYYSAVKENYKYVKLYKSLKECNDMIDALRKSNNGYFGFNIKPLKY